MSLVRSSIGYNDSSDYTWVCYIDNVCGYRQIFRANGDVRRDEVGKLTELRNRALEDRDQWLNRA